MRLDALLDFGPRHGQQSFRQLHELRVFFRRPSHMPPIIARVVVVVALASACATASQEPAPGGRERKSGPPDSKPERTQQQPAIGTQASPAVVKISKTDAETAQEEADRQQQAATQRWTLLLAGITALIGIGQLWMIQRQAGIAERQNSIMNNQSTLMDGQLVATQKAASASTKSVELAERSLIDTQRAFLLMTKFNSTAHVDRETKKVMAYEVTMIFLNSGQTPAIDAHCHIFKIVVEDSPSAVDIPTHAAMQTPSNIQGWGDSTVAVGHDGTMKGKPIFITMDEVERLTKREIAVFVHAYVEYRDIFPGTPIRRTGVCSKIVFNPLTDARYEHEYAVMPRSGTAEHTFFD
jgi:hypothetical protein